MGIAATKNIYIGYDPREALAYRVCIESLKSFDTGFAIQPVGMRFVPQYQRPTRTVDGKLWDDISGAHMATEFSLARFWVPHIQRSGWALYCDCDFMFRAPVDRLFAMADDRYACMVVKHNHSVKFEPGTKMDGQVQNNYPRKNWSSLVLWNCSHPKVSAYMHPAWLNEAVGRSLHAFNVFNDDEIGELPLEWNWLAGVSQHVDNPQAVHFTLGTPDMKGYETCYGRYGDEWRQHAYR
jgi:hypothetical protein